MKALVRSGLRSKAVGSAPTGANSKRVDGMTQAKKIPGTVSSPKSQGVCKIPGTVSGPC